MQLVVDLRKYFNLFTKNTLQKSELNSYFEGVDKNLREIFEPIFDRIIHYGLHNYQEDIFVIRVNFTVVESFKSPNGKFADSYGNVAIIDWNYIIPTFTEAFLQNLDKHSSDKSLLENMKKLIDPIDKIDVRNYVLEVDAVLKDKINHYSNNGAVSTSVNVLSRTLRISIYNKQRNSIWTLLWQLLLWIL